MEKIINIDVRGMVNHIPSTSANGTSLKGSIDESYERLVEVFGEPNGFGDDLKVRCEWVINTPSGVATIYDWKDIVDVEDVRDWHIGGKTSDVVEWVQKALKGGE